MSPFRWPSKRVCVSVYAHAVGLLPFSYNSIHRVLCDLAMGDSLYTGQNWADLELSTRCHREERVRRRSRYCCIDTVGNDIYVLKNLYF